MATRRLAQRARIWAVMAAPAASISVSPGMPASIAAASARYISPTVSNAASNAPSEAIMARSFLCPP
jgi:hypothetical protein